MRPILLGAANVRSPEFVAQPEIVFSDTAARYEPGVLNLGPILGMQASLDMILDVGPEVVSSRIASHVARLAASLGELGFEPLGPVVGPNASGILTVAHPRADAPKLFQTLQERGVSVSLRRDRANRAYLRWSPHFYNTEEELDRAVAILRSAV